MASIEPARFTWETDPDGKRVKRPARGTNWRARYRDPRGRSRSKVFARKIDADRFLERQGSEIQAGAFRDPRLQRRRFEEWADEWLAGLAVQPTTLRGYGQARQRLARHFDGRQVGAIDRPVVRQFVAWMRARDYAPKTVRSTLSVLKMILDFAMECRAISENPAAGLRLGASRRHEPMFFDPGLIHLLVAHTEEPFATWALFDAYAGLRPSEVCGVKVKNLDLLRGRVTVAEVINEVNGKAIPGPTKTYAIRTVPIPPSVREALARHLERRKEQLGRELAPDDYVFAAVKGGLLHVSKVRKAIRKGLRAAGLPPEFRTYDLRHTCASLLIASGAHPRAIMERLGHSSITTTLNLYGHLFPELEAELTDRLEDMYQASATAADEEPNIVKIDRDHRPTDAEDDPEEATG